MGNETLSNYHNIGEESSALCIATVGVTPDGKVFPVRCKRWACKVCAPINALHEAIRTANGIAALYSEGIRPKFATITQPGKIQSPAFAYSILSSQWDVFRQRWERWARKVETPNIYAAFVEGQSRRDGMPHFHIIGASLPDKEQLRKWVVKSGFGYQVSLEALKPSLGVAWYVSKYSTKGSDAQYIPKGFRRVRYSRDWPQMLFKSDLLESTSIVRLPHESYAHWLLRAVSTFGVDPNETMQQVQNLTDQTEGTEQADYAAKTMMVLEQWA